MNKQRKVLITITYNELGIIVDTKTEELGSPAQPEHTETHSCDYQRTETHEWIPCDETVEVPDHEVLACDKYGEEILGYLEYADDLWTCASEDCVMYDPIAWMEKPEPYKQPDKRTAEELSNDIRRMATGAGVSIEQTAIYTSSQR